MVAGAFVFAGQGLVQALLSSVAHLLCALFIIYGCVTLCTKAVPVEQMDNTALSSDIFNEGLLQ